MSFTPQIAKRNIRCIQFLSFVYFGYVFAIPSMVNYIALHTEGVGENYFFLATITSIVAIFFALPIGSVSDIYERRTMMIIGTILKVIAWSLFLVFPSIWSFLLGFVMYKIGDLLFHDSTCVYETLDASGEQDSYKKVERTIHAYPQYAMIVALPLAGYLYSLSPSYPFILNIVISILGVGAAFLYTEAPRLKTENSNILTQMKALVILTKKSQKLKWFSLYNGIMQGVSLMIIFLFQVKYFLIEGSVLSFSLLATGVYLARALGAQVSHKIFDSISNITQTLLLLLTLGYISLFSIGFVENKIVFAILTLIYMFVRGVQSPVLNYIFHDLVTSNIRATAYSVVTMYQRLSLILINAGVGYSITVWGINATIFVFSSIIMFVGGVILLLIERATKNHKNLLTKSGFFI